MKNATEPETTLETAAPPIFFLHGPKAGGTAINTRFARAFAPEDVSPTIERIPSDRNPDAWHAFARYKYISGHCGHEVYRSVGARHLLVTNFRLPVSRIVSLYDYWRNNFGEDDDGHNYPLLNAPRLVRKLTFAEFIRSDDPAAKLYVRNAHSRQLLDSAWLYRDLNFFDLLRLKWRVRHLHWFYVCEKPKQSEVWFKHQFPQFPATPLGVENPTDYASKPKTVPTQDDLAVIRQHNACDLAIHKYASELLERRVGDITGSSPGLLGHRRITSGFRFIKRLPRTIAQIERRLEALENSGRTESQSAPQPVAVAEPVSEAAAMPAPEPSTSSDSQR